MAQMENGQQHQHQQHIYPQSHSHPHAEPPASSAPASSIPQTNRLSWQVNDDWSVRQATQQASGVPSASSPQQRQYSHDQIVPSSSPLQQRQYSHNHDLSQDSLQYDAPLTVSTKRKAVPSAASNHHEAEMRLQDAPASPVSINPPQMGILAPERASISQAMAEEDSESRRSSRNVPTPDSGKGRVGETMAALPIRVTSRVPITQSEQRASYHDHSRASSGAYYSPQRIDEESEEFSQVSEPPQSPGLQYHHFEDRKPKSRISHATTSSASSGEHRRSASGTHAGTLNVPRTVLSRPASSHTLGADLRGRTLSPLSANGSDPGSPAGHLRNASRSPASRPLSYVDSLNNLPYSQQIAPGPPLNNHSLQSAVGSAASLLDTKKTLEMYRANVKKTNDAAVQYSFAIFMITAARDAMPGDGLDPNELTTEAKHILQRLSDRAYPFAQYYLADGYFSGLFSKGKPDFDRAFPLFVAASKHGHAEAGYRAALCYEFGWGTTKAYPKAVQFYRQAASKNHPGAATRLGLACISGDMGLRDKYREGVKWLKRASESADFQYNAGPYELGMMHLTGYGNDVFKDEAYAAQLLTQSAELGHMDANFTMGRAYENGLYGCPRDAALSVHFYNGAAIKGHVEGMMALCAWYMVGAEPVLEKDEAEAFAWAKQAAETGYAKAEYAIGYFTEMGIGCRRDPLEANMWYVRAADKGNETARQRLAIIREAASGEPGLPMEKGSTRVKDPGGKEKKKFMGIF